MRDHADGTVEGTGSAISVSVGFVPNIVKLRNIDGDAILDWSSDMGAGKGYKILGTGAGELIATGGVTVKGTSESDTIRGFSIGTDSDVNASGETITWEAYR